MSRGGSQGAPPVGDSTSVDADPGTFAAGGDVAIGAAVGGALYVAIAPDEPETTVALAIAIGTAHGYGVTIQRSGDGCRVLRFEESTPIGARSP